MIIATGSCSRKFGDICYTFVIFITNISDFIVERLLTWLNEKNYPLYFFIVILVNCFLHFVCIYFLVGSRIHLLMTDPEYDMITSSNNKNSTDITQFISLRSKIRSMSIIKIINSTVSTNSTLRSRGSTINSFKSSNPCIKNGNGNANANANVV